MTTTTRTRLYCAIETGASCWHLALTMGVAHAPRRRQINARDVARLAREIAEAKERFGLDAAASVHSCYEAGREGFWLHRWLVTHGVDNRVVDSASIQVDRRARHAKTDQIDAAKLVQQLIRDVAGEPHVWSVVQVPTVEEEDGRQLHRELETVKHDQVRVLNRIRGLLATQGVTWNRKQKWSRWIPMARTGDGHALPAGLRARLEREWAHFHTLDARVAAIQAARAAQLRQAADPLIAQVCQLMMLRGVGVNGAWLLVMELCGWRSIRNRRQLAALAGLVGMPYQSGDSARAQGISKAGNRRVRWMMGQLAWAWLRYQPDSALSQWFHRRFAQGGPRLRRIGIVALARKLLVDLWRWLRDGVLPDGALTKSLADTMAT